MKVEATIQSPTRKASQITLELGRKGGIVVDTELNAESKNPVTNEAVTAVWDILRRGLIAANEESTKIKNSVQENSADITKANEEITKIKNSVQENSADITKANEEITKTKNELSKKANDNDYYPKMSVGFADNLVGRGDVKKADFTFRTSAAHDNIADDTARVKRIKGNSVVWNQLRNDTIISNRSLTVSQSNGSFTFSEATSQYARVNIGKTAVWNHKYLLRCEVVENTFAMATITSNNNGMTNGALELSNTSGFCEAIVTKTLVATTNEWQFMINDPDYAGKSATIKDIVIIDLTQMFGADNEPESVAEFYARIPSGIDINAYNEGEIINLNTKAIKTVGFNQWDEQWINGRATIYENGLRSKNFIKVLPDTKYYFHNGTNLSYAPVVRFHDENANLSNPTDYETGFISLESLLSDRIFTTPSNCAYILFYIPSDYKVTEYNHNVCINIAHTNWRNGQYAPYTPFKRELPIIQKYFPNGMRSAGNVFDSIEWDSSKQKWVAVQRIKEAKLKDLWWTKTEKGAMTAPITDKNGGRNFIMAGRALSNTYSINYDPATHFYWGNSLCVKDTIYGANDSNRFFILSDETDIANLLNASELHIYYELVEPIVTDIEENINFDYYVEDFGTEEALSDVPSTPFRADVVYTPNAVDDIRALLQRVSAVEKGIKPYTEAYVFEAFPAMQERGGIDISKFKELFKAVEKEKMILFKENADGVEFFSPVFIGANVRYEEYEDPDSGDAYSLDVLDLYLPGNRRWHFELKDGSELSDEVIYG